ncbi:MKRN2 opposite strand protein isoform X2 [Synchiropus splendidus]|uniref:MKRN2 opposite strand protein isoform X2 n=1 Tax=Synchiropus splendidus TaxID=270530 RepID=UPI00237D9729|nr:MKRN2 opposite strand protein isoform X2 [Synchiropus splendidus]
MERSVLCFSHCDSNIFCFQLPAECPSCGEEVGGHHLQEAPVSLPPPFTDGHKSSCCLLITAVDRDFSDSSELHTGISDTSGVVYNYTCAGVLRDTMGPVPADILVQTDVGYHLAQLPRGQPQLLQLLSSVHQQRNASGGSATSVPRGLHSDLHTSQDDKGFKVSASVCSPTRTPVLPGGQTIGCLFVFV